MKSKTTKALGIGSAALALSSLFTGELYKYTFCRDIGLFKLLPERKKHDEGYYALRDGTAQRLREARCIRRSIVNADGQTLRGFYYPCGEKPGKKVVFIVHGYRSEHAETAGMYLNYYHSRGFDLFCCDHAGHGESDGRLIGWSVTESCDCLQWLDELETWLGSDIQVILHGFSMGGASVLKMSDRCGDAVKFIISDSGFSDFDRLAKKKISGMYAPLRAINCVVGGYDVRDADVRPNLSRSRKPILFVHGKLDPTVPFYMGQELYEHYQGEKDCLFTDDARHIETMYLHPREYMEKIDAFIERYIK